MQNCRRWAADIFYLSRKTTRDGADSLKDGMNASDFSLQRISVLFLLERRESDRTSACACPQWQGEAKFWLHPMVHLNNSSGFDARTLRELAEAVEQNATLIEKAWNEHFG